MPEFGTPLVRPGSVTTEGAMPRVVAFFPNAAPGNLAIQMAGVLGIPADRLGVTPPDRLPRGQGMLLSIPCPDQAVAQTIEELCRRLGADIHRVGPGR